MTKILAVSGGLDSMVMLHLFQDDPDIIVAHFNHGTRPSADADQLFVQNYTKNRQIKFIVKKAHLGANVSEAVARAARYQFLRQTAAQFSTPQKQAQIYTAHHADDLLESIAINLYRGTGWRGLAPLDRSDIIRPLLHLQKSDLYYYAAKHQLHFREDPTNQESHYLRNRLRPQVRQLEASTKAQLLQLAESQKSLKSSIDQILQTIAPPDQIYQRAWFFRDSPLNQASQLELLRFGLTRANFSATRPQLLDFLSAIRTYQPGKSFNLPGNHLVKIYKTYFKLP